MTVRIPHLDSTAVHIAVDLLQPGDVLVVDTSGDVERTCFGGLVGYATSVKRVAGVGIDGAITDVGQLLLLNLPIFYRYLSAVTTRMLGIEGEVNVPMSVAGAVVLPGDLLVEDEHDVIVVLRGEPRTLQRIAAEKEAREPSVREALERGQALKDLSGTTRFAEYMPNGPACDS